MNRGRIETAWLSYRHFVMPKVVSAIQERETRRAFYAGADSLLNAIVGMLEGGSEPTTGELVSMDGIAQEIRQFLVEVKEGRA